MKNFDAISVVHFGQNPNCRGDMATVQNLFLGLRVPGVEQRLFPVYEGGAIISIKSLMRKGR